MAKLTTKYLGLELKSPVIVSAGPYTQTIESLKKLEAAGAGAVVLKSIFEEQIEEDVANEYKANEDYLNWSVAESHFKEHGKDYYIDRYMRLLIEAKKNLSIPVIASVCCKTTEEWIDYAERFVNCKADAIELNYYPLASDASVDGKDVEKTLFEFAKLAKKKISCPVAIKMGNKYSSMANVISKLDAIGIDGAVLFNRFYRPDIDIENLSFVHGPELSSPVEYSEALRWIGLSSGEVKMDLCGNTGIHDGETVVKMLLAGARAVEVCTVIIREGAEAITKMNDFISSWMDKKGYDSLDQFIGKLAQERNSEGYKWERTQFLNMIK